MVRELKIYKEEWLQITKDYKKYTKEELAVECDRRLRMAEHIYEDWADNWKYLKEMNQKLEAMVEVYKEEKQRLIEQIDSLDKYSALADLIADIVKKDVLPEVLDGYVKHDELSDAIDNIEYEREAAEARAWT